MSDAEGDNSDTWSQSTIDDVDEAKAMAVFQEKKFITVRPRRPVSARARCSSVLRCAGRCCAVAGGAG